MTTPSSDRRALLDRFAVIRARRLEDLRQINISCSDIRQTTH